MRQSHRGHLRELFISAEEEVGPWEEVQGREGIEKRNRRKASCVIVWCVVCGVVVVESIGVLNVLWSRCCCSREKSEDVYRCC